MQFNSITIVPVFSIVKKFYNSAEQPVVNHANEAVANIPKSVRSSISIQMHCYGNFIIVLAILTVNNKMNA